MTTKETKSKPVSRRSRQRIPVDDIEATKSGVITGLFKLLQNPPANTTIILIVAISASLAYSMAQLHYANKKFEVSMQLHQLGGRASRETEALSGHGGQPKQVDLELPSRRN